MRDHRQHRLALEIARAVLLPAATLVAACSTVSTVKPVGPAAAAKPQDCPIKVLREGPRPERYAVVGNIETHVKRNGWFGGKATLDDAIPELMHKGCALGGDTVWIENVLTSGAAEDSHVHVWAVVLHAQGS